MADSEVSALCDKVTVESDAALGNMQTRLTVLYQDGEEVVQFSNAPLGEVENPLSFEQIKGKFMSLAAPVYGVEKAEKVEEYVDGIEDRGVAGLMTLLA